MLHRWRPGTITFLILISFGLGVIEAPSRIRKRPSMDIPNPAGELGWGSRSNNWELFVTDDSTSDVHSGESLQQLGVLRY